MKDQILIKNLKFTGKHFAALALALSLFSWLPATTFAGQTVVDVRVGGEADLDACGGTGKVHNLKVDGDNFLAVRGGPASHHHMIDRLHTNDQVIMCDQQGQWVGIIYGADGQDCGVSSPIPRRQPYSGVCSSGWVHKNYIKPIAG